MHIPSPLSSLLLRIRWALEKLPWSCHCFCEPRPGNITLFPRDPCPGEPLPQGPLNQIPLLVDGRGSLPLCLSYFLCPCLTSAQPTGLCWCYPRPPGARVARNPDLLSRVPPLFLHQEASSQDVGSVSMRVCRESTGLPAT